MALCPTFLRNGICISPDCTLDHDVFRCDVCGICCHTQNDLDRHIVGPQHKKNASIAPHVGQVRCTICQVAVSGPFATHANGKHHQRQVAKLGPKGSQVINNGAAPSLNVVHCSICDQDVFNCNWFVHLNDTKHKRLERLDGFSPMLWDSEQDKCDVEVVEAILDFGFIDINTLEQDPAIVHTLRISLQTRNPIDLVEVRMTSSLAESAKAKPEYFTPDFSGVERMEDGMDYCLDIEFTPEVGIRRRYQDRVELVFENIKVRQRFIITRLVTAIVGTQKDVHLFGPPIQHSYPIHSMLKPPETDDEESADSRELFAHIPRFVRDALEDGSDQDKIERVKRSILPPKFNADSHRMHWKTILWIEELLEMRGLRQYDMSGELQEYESKDRTFYTLSPNVRSDLIVQQLQIVNVPNLLEDRPSLIKDDKVEVAQDGDDHWHRGNIRYISNDQVHLYLPRHFFRRSDSLYNFRWSVENIDYRCLRQTLETGFFPPRILCPDPSHLENLHSPSLLQMEAISLFNSSISENQNQLTAIACILNRPPGSMPFIITGPPGTGKTIIIVEAIRQLLHRDPASRILVCASPYGAADMICEHLIPLGSEKVFRCNSPTRPPATIPPVLKDFCEKGDFRERMKECQVVISSAMSCMGFPSVIGRDHFTHIFIDNAGQVSEPKVMVPILELGGLQTNIILSGDPSQIRPNAKSSISRKLGLGTSYMERLMHLPVYDEKLYGGITIVRLTDNIRSHPDILKVPKEELYQSEIKHRSISEFHDRLSVWRGLPKKGFPIIFHSLEGQDERHPSSSSIFNLDEAFAVRKYVQNLCSDGLLNLTDNHIGVISPYKGQNIKIRGMLRARNPMIKVDSPDDFQGQERQVIIISTVRSRVDTVAQDLDHNLGFLGQPRRFNVAINLAQALLIVIGNPNVLGLDPLWRTFLNHVHQNGGWRGSAIPWDPREVVNIPAISVEAEADMNEDELVEQVRLLALEERKRQERFSCDQNEGDHYISL